MELLIGWIFLSIIFFFIFVWIKKYPETKNFLLVAFLLRAICVVLDNYEIITLPGSNADDDTFERKARAFSNNYGILVLIDFFKLDSFLVSRIISLFYTIFGESKMMAKTISLSLGTASVYLVYVLSNILWDRRAAKKAAWVAVFFPTLILYSSLTLREVYIVFFLLLGLISIANYMRHEKVLSLIKTLIIFYILIFLHGGASIGVFVFLLYVVIRSLKKQFAGLINFKIIISHFLISLIAIIPIILFATENLSIPYLTTIYDIDSIFKKANIAIERLDANTAYPDWLIINNIYEFFPKLLVKTIYFLYSPFAWQIKSFSQIIGFIDGTLYLILTIYLIKNIKGIWANPIARLLFIIFLTYIVIHGLGVGNFGTAIRHRSKFVVILIVLAAPVLHKFIFNSQKKKIIKNNIK
jgi:hypothetical protein